MKKIKIDLEEEEYLSPFASQNRNRILYSILICITFISISLLLFTVRNATGSSKAPTS